MCVRRVKRVYNSNPFHVGLFEVNRNFRHYNRKKTLHDKGKSIIIKINKSGRTAERIIKPKLISIFKSENLKITVDSVSQVIDYLDVKFNLSNHMHEPYRKPNNPILYLNIHSNHPQHITKQVPKIVELRLSILSKT